MTKILMVEDHAFFSETLAFLLERQFSEGPLGQASFHRTNTLKEGLRLVAEAGPFGLAIIDLMLPDGDGTEVVREIKASCPETPVAVLSSIEDLSGAPEAGADKAISKSIHLQEIVAILEQLVWRGSQTVAYGAAASQERPNAGHRL